MDSDVIRHESIEIVEEISIPDEDAELRAIEEELANIVKKSKEKRTFRSFFSRKEKDKNDNKSTGEENSSNKFSASDEDTEMYRKSDISNIKQEKEKIPKKKDKKEKKSYVKEHFKRGENRRSFLRKHKNKKDSGGNKQKKLNDKLNVDEQDACQDRHSSRESVIIIKENKTSDVNEEMISVYEESPRKFSYKPPSLSEKGDKSPSLKSADLKESESSENEIDQKPELIENEDIICPSEDQKLNGIETELNDSFEDKKSVEADPDEIAVEVNGHDVKSDVNISNTSIAKSSDSLNNELKTEIIEMEESPSKKINRNSMRESMEIVPQKQDLDAITEEKTLDDSPSNDNEHKNETEDSLTAIVNNKKQSRSRFRYDKIFGSKASLQEFRPTNLNKQESKSDRNIYRSTYDKIFGSRSSMKGSIVHIVQPEDLPRKKLLWGEPKIVVIEKNQVGLSVIRLLISMKYIIKVDFKSLNIIHHLD